MRIEYGTVSVDGSGNIITKAGTLANDFTFSTQMAYGASGWSMYMFRNYSPRLGRWTQRDPIGLANLYTFCRNSPINLVDVLGLEAGDAAQRARALDIFSKALAAAGGLCLVIALCSNPLTATAMIFYGFAGGLGFSGLLIQLGVAIFGPHGGNRLNCPDQDEQDQEGEPEADGEGPQEGVEPPIADQLGFVPQPGHAYLKPSVSPNWYKYHGDGEWESMGPDYAKGRMDRTYRVRIPAEGWPPTDD